MRKLRVLGRLLAMPFIWIGWVMFWVFMFLVGVVVTVCVSINEKLPDRKHK